MEDSSLPVCDNPATRLTASRSPRNKHHDYIHTSLHLRAPESFAQPIVKAVADVTQEPIVQLVYSHAHVDHIAGAGLLVFRTLLDGVVTQCTAEIQGRWISTLAGVDMFGESHCRAALIDARWDD